MSVQLAYRESGQGPPLIILHGLFGSATNWRSIARELGVRHRVLALDLRNHGNSPHTETMDYPSMAKDVYAFMQRHGLERAAVLGHSMGGKTAMQLALMHPEHVERLVVVDIAPVTTEEDHAPYITAMQNLDFSNIRRRSDADAELEIPIPEPGVRTFLLQNLTNENGSYRWRLNLDGIEAGLPALAGFPDQPAGACYRGATLFVRGARSPYVRQEHRTIIDELFPGARIRTIEAAGHWVHVDQPREFLVAVEEFLGRGQA